MQLVRTGPSIFHQRGFVAGLLIFLSWRKTAILREMNFEEKRLFFKASFVFIVFVLAGVSCRKDNERRLAFGSFSEKKKPPLFILLLLLLSMMKINYWCV